MIIDPHDQGTRLAAHRKNDAEEGYLAAVNARLERAVLPPLASSAAPEDLPIVYVVGAPRSGTTLLHQLLARHLAVSYVDNVVARFWLRPSVGVVLSQNVGARRGEIELRSRHGVSEGAAGPHEFGYFWRHWLPFDQSPNHHLDAALRASVDREGLGRTLRDELLAPAGRPFVFKNVICGFHAELLTAVHARSLFVHITRDEAVTTRSILHSRFERYGDYSTWWSLKPSSYPFEPGLTPAEEVVRQVRDSRSDFSEALAAPGIHALELAYEELCASPVTTLERVRGAVSTLGSPLPPLAGSVTELRASAGPSLPPALEADLARALGGELLP